LLDAVLGLEHNSDGAVMAVDKCLPGGREIREGEVVRDQRLYVDRAAREEVEAASGDAFRVRQRTKDVEVSADDGAQVDAAQVAPGRGAPGEHDAPAAPRKLDCLPRGL